MNENRRRLGEGIDIYRSAMRMYIAQTMQHWESGDWFTGLVVPALSPWRQEKIAEDLSENMIDSVDISDFPDVIRNNKNVFPSYLAGKKRERSKAVTWMYEISDWRNDWAHPTTDDFSDRDTDRALDTCARVLHLFDLEAEKNVRKLYRDLQDMKRELENEQAKHEETKQIVAKADDFKIKLETEKDEHRNTQKELQDANWLKSKAEKDKHKTEGVLQELKEKYDETQQALQDEQEARRHIEGELEEVRHQLKSSEEEARKQLEDARSQTSSKPPSVQVVARNVESYRKRFKKANSGNGWRYTTEVNGWSVTRWVGKSAGQHRACVFSPWRQVDNTDAAEWPLINQRCNSEEDGFRYLQDLDHGGAIEQRARKAIEEYNTIFSMPNSVPEDSKPDSPSDEDIPF